MHSEAPAPLKPLRHHWDFHSHLLPCVDDGMTSLDQALEAIRAMIALGYTGAVLTPHIYRGVFDNDTAALRQAFQPFAAALARVGSAFELRIAAEYFADEHLVALIERDDILSVAIGAERWVLIEFPCFQETPYASVCMAALVKRGYRPVIAHVERYRFVARNPKLWLARFAGAGAVLQANIGSLAGQYGEDVRRFAALLCGRANIAIWATDLHHPDQIARYIIPGMDRLRAVRRPWPPLHPILSGDIT